MQIDLNPNHTNRAMVVDLSLAQECIATAEILSEKMQHPALISPMDIMKWPGVLKDRETETEPFHDNILQTCQALDKLLEGRRREGKS